MHVIPRVLARHLGAASRNATVNYPPDSDVAVCVLGEGELGQKFMLLETALKCQCGCGLDVHSCQFQMQCAESPAWSLRIREALEAGESVEVIQASFVADFGGQVLMMPPAEGFTLLGYLLPALAILSAGMMAVLVARGGQNEKTLAPVNQVSDEDAEKLRAAMKKLDEAESPDW